MYIYVYCNREKKPIILHPDLVFELTKTKQEEEEEHEREEKQLLFTAKTTFIDLVLERASAKVKSVALCYPAQVISEA